MSTTIQEQLANIRDSVRKAPPEPDAVAVDLESGVAEVRAPVVQRKIELSTKDQRDFIDNHKKLQQAAIREKNFSMLMNVGMAVLAIITTIGSGYALYKGAKGQINHPMK